VSAPTLARALRLVDAAVARLETREAPALDRRRFLRAGGGALATALLAACNAQGPAGAQAVLRFAERRNERVERWLLRHTRMGAPLDRVPGG
jgi:hypothetical protein